jgi:S-adenosyl methyltransferase
VYLVLEPIMLAHAHDLVAGAPEGTVAYIQARLSDPDEILRQAAKTLDLTQPVAVVFPASLPFVRRDATAQRIVGRMMAGVAPGSFLAITHHASDIRTEELDKAYRRLRELAAEGKSLEVKPRNHDEVAAFFDGLDLLEPGVVSMERWRAPDGEPPDPRPGAFYGAVGRKP